jgi:uncharacterized BrkB/YihY/UPF0761 family membrane protein
MGAAFAYNALFAAVPLALAFVTVLTMLDRSQDVLTDTYRFFTETLPPEIASFLIQMLSESVAVVEQNRFVIMVVTLLIALWSGSRAVYTIQKALRLIETPEAEVGYVQLRSVGIFVTIAGGVGVFAAYTVLVAGMDLLGRLAPERPTDLILGELVVAGIAIAWVFGLLYAIYRWGAPQPLRKPATTAALVTAVVVAGTWIAINIVPSGSAATVAVFGAMGVILLWLYGVGMVVVAGPIAVGSFMKALEKK